MPPKYRDIQKRIEQEGWRMKAQRGSHKNFVHPTKPGKVTLSGKPSDTPPENTYSSILRQAGLTR